MPRKPPKIFAFSLIKARLSRKFGLNAEHMSALCGWNDRRRSRLRDEPEEVDEQVSGNGDLGHLEGDVTAMTCDLRADLDEFLLESRHRPVLDRVRRRQRAQEISKIAGQRMKLKSNSVGGERRTIQARPFDRTLALLEPLLKSPALVVEGEDVLGAPP